MKHRHTLLSIIFVLFIYTYTSAQEAIILKEITFEIYIQDDINVPTVTNNGDDTITLTHQDTGINTIFSKYSIYDFKRAYPTVDTEPLRKHYTITFDSKELIYELQQNVSDEIFEFITNPSLDTTPIHEDIITQLDGLSFNILKYDSISDIDCSFDCDDSNPLCETCQLQDIPNDFDFSISFDYSALEDVLYATSDGLSPCGNEFSVALKGGDPDDFYTAQGSPTLQLWHIISVTASITDDSQSCHFIEQTLYKLLGISTDSSDIDSDTIQFYVNPETTHFRLHRNNATFGEDIVEFSVVRLSLEQETFKDIKLISSNDSSYINFVGTNRLKNYYVEVFSITGKNIIKKTLYKKNHISLNSSSKGLYLIMLTDSQNNSKTYKYLH